MRACVCASLTLCVCVRVCLGCEQNGLKEATDRMMELPEQEATPPHDKRSMTCTQSECPAEGTQHVHGQDAHSV